MAQADIGNNNFLVSVVIPTYNRADLLARAVESVLAQTYKNIEIIIVDDFSSDQTEKVANDLKTGDDRIKYVRQETNQGAPAARNRGIKMARGQFIGLLDDDDEYLPDKIKLQIDKFSKLGSNYGLIYGGYQEINSVDGKKKQTVFARTKGRVFSKLLEKSFIGSPTVLVRAECFDKVGVFDLELKSCQDWDMWLRIAKEYNVDYVDRVVANYYIHKKGNISSNFDSRIQGTKIMFFKYKKYLDKNPKAKKKHLDRVRYNLIAGDQKWLALIWQLRVIKNNPFRIKNWRNLIALIFIFSVYRKRVLRD